MWWLTLVHAEENIEKTEAENLISTEQSVEWARCYPNGVRQEAMCATIEVPVDHAERSNGSMSLHVVMLPAIRSKAKEDPVFVLAGGPGQGASETIATLYPSLRKIHQQRGLIFLDQRGTGKSGALHCELPDNADMSVPLEDLQKCYAELPHNAQWYQTSHLADDTNWVRQTLGYEQINLYGVSYGTRLGLTIMNRHPESIRSAVLDGVVPFQKAIGGDFGLAVRHSFQDVFTACSTDVDCHGAFPNLEEEYRLIIQELQNKGPRIIQHPHSVTGVVTETEVSDQVLWGVLQQMLYQSVTTSLIPYALHSIAESDDWSTVVGWMGNSPFEGIPVGLYLSIMCAEDVPRIDFSSEYSMDLGVQSTVQLQEMCSVWPTTQVNPISMEWGSQTPTLLLSGEFDPVTPPLYGDLALSMLRNATHLVVSGMGHNTIHQPCIADIVTEFYQSGKAETLDTTCASTLNRPPFILSATGTAP